MIINPYTFATSSTDPYFSSVALLIQSPQTNGSTTIVDASSVGRAITVGGTVASTTSQAKFGVASINFAGAASDKLTWTSFSLTGDFTIEMFVRESSVNTGYEIVLSGGASSGWQNVLLDFNAGTVTRSTGYLGGYFNGPRGGSNASVIATNTWHYLAITRSSNTVKFYLDGTQQGSGFTVSGSIPFTGVSDWGSASYSLIGQIDQLRITNGVVRNVSNVPTSPFPTS